ncbi:hypothetical protein CHUAL_009153 [Chamberlinius hualienensis]
MNNMAFPTRRRLNSTGNICFCVIWKLCKDNLAPSMYLMATKRPICQLCHPPAQYVNIFRLVLPKKLMVPTDDTAIRKLGARASLFRHESVSLADVSMC